MTKGKGRKKKDLSECKRTPLSLCYIQLTSFNSVFESHDTDSTVIRCLVCKEADPLGVGTWIKCAGHRAHLERDIHKSNVVLKTEREAQRALDAAHLQRIYSGPHAEPSSSYQAGPSNHRPGITDTFRPQDYTILASRGDTEDSDISGSDADSDAFISSGGDQDAPFDMEFNHEPEMDLGLYKLELRRQVEELFLHWDQVELEDEDLTETNIADELLRLGKYLCCYPL